MSVVSNPLIGNAKQSMGGATFSRWKGIQVLKTKATTVANPRSDTQVAQRAAFTFLVSVFRAIPSVVRAGFKKLAIKKSEFNAFTSSNLPSAFNVSAPPAATFVPTSMVTAKGTITTTPILVLTADRSANTIVTTFATAASQPGQSSTDLAVVACWNSDYEGWAGAVTAAARSTGTASITLPAAWSTGEALVAYLFFINELTGESADSDNITGIIVA